MQVFSILSAPHITLPQASCQVSFQLSCLVTAKVAAPACISFSLNISLVPFILSLPSDASCPLSLPCSLLPALQHFHLAKEGKPSLKQKQAKNCWNVAVHPSVWISAFFLIEKCNFRGIFVLTQQLALDLRLVSSPTRGAEQSPGAVLTGATLTSAARGPVLLGGGGELLPGCSTTQ